MTATQQPKMKKRLVHREDYRNVRKINPEWPEFYDVEITADFEIKGRLNGIWIDGNLIGMLSTSPTECGYRIID